jgi:DNA-binding NarL/FixJ family response regulator
VEPPHAMCRQEEEMRGNALAPSTISVLLVDDYEPWRRFVCSALQKLPHLRVVGEASNGLEAVQMSQQLQPDLILLDIGLPALNGIDAARRIRRISPQSKILFISENRSRDVADQALRTGARGYIVKSAAISDLLPGLKVILEDGEFVSGNLTGPSLVEHERCLYLASSVD